MELTREKIKRGIILSVSVSTVAIIMVVLFTRDDFSYTIFTRIDPTYLLLAGYITIFFWFLKSLKLKVLTQAMGGEVPLGKMFSIYLASAFVAHVTPSSSGGLPFIIYFIHREGLPLGKATALTVMDSIFNLLFYLVAAPVLIVAWGEFFNLGPVMGQLFYTALILVMGFILVTMLLIFNTHLTLIFVEWLIGLSFIRKMFAAEKLMVFRDYVEREINYFDEGLELLTGKKRELMLVIIYTILYWIFYLGLAYIILLGLGVRAALPPVILAQLVFNFIQPVIPTPGGSGGAELSSAYLFKFIVPNYLLGIFVALWRFFMFYFSMIVGGIFFIYLVRGTDFLEQEEKI